ncbi:MAG: FtsX-like permease family protein [Pirellulaceae bacterium]
MSIWRIAWRNVTQRGLASALTAFSMALGVALVTSVLIIHGVVSRSFMDNSNLGYDLIGGAKGGKLQLVLNTTFYLSEPIEAIPYSFYQEFLSAEQQRTELARMNSDTLNELTDGEFHSNIHFAIPVCLGDYLGPFRVVGTLPKFFELFPEDYGEGLKYKFRAGQNMRPWSEDHGYYEAVIGSVVAKRMGIEVGDQITPSHGGDPNDVHNESPFTVVGILEHSGTPNDRAVFINMEGFYLMDGHAKIDPEDPSMTAPTGEGGIHRAPLQLKQREITAVLIRSNGAIDSRILNRRINKGTVAQAARPIMEITRLFELFVYPIQSLLLVLTFLICIVSGISVLVSIYNSMNDRRREIGVMRALGARRRTVMGVILLESIILSVGGGLAGWLGGHLILAAASPAIEERTGVAIGPFDLAPLPRTLEVKVPEVIIESALGGLLSLELVIIPALLLLAVIVGFLPAYTAYRTDVAEALSNSP